MIVGNSRCYIIRVHPRELWVLVFQNYWPKSQNRTGHVDGFRGSLCIAELTLDRLQLHRGDHSLTDQRQGEHQQAPPPPTSLISNDARIAYVFGRKNTLELQGTTLAMLEEACELGAQYPGRVSIWFDGGMGSERQHEGAALSLDRLATAFVTASGSLCDLKRAIKLGGCQPRRLSTCRFPITDGI
jgi:hypothetical protein